MVSRFVRKVRTASGAVAVQVVTRRGRQVERIEHVGSAHSDDELALLLASARERLTPGQGALDLGEVAALPARLDEVADWTSEREPAGQQVLETTGAAAVSPRRGRPVAGAGGQVVATSSLVLWKVLTDAYARLGFDELADEAFRAMALARIVEPTSKADSLRVLAEIGAPCPSVRTLYRSLKRCQDNDYRGALAKACAARSSAAGGLSAMVMYDCTTLHFEISDEDTGSKPLRKVGMSNYAEVSVMPRSVPGWRRPCCSAAWAGVARAA